MERHRRAAAAGRAKLLQLALRLAALKRHLEALAVALDGCDQLARQRVDDRCADAVQAARYRVALAALELAARVQGREDHLEGALLEFLHHVDGNAATVVFDGTALAVLVQR